MGNNENSWHLSKSVPVTLIVALVLQFAGFLWTTSQVYSQVETNTDNISQVEVKLDNVQNEVHDQEVQLGRIEENVRATRHSVERIERLFDGASIH